MFYIVTYIKVECQPVESGREPERWLVSKVSALSPLSILSTTSYHTAMTNLTPAEDELHSTIVQLRQDHPSLGVLKLLAQLKTDHPTWAVSEKRFRKALQVVAPTPGITTQEKQDVEGKKDDVSADGKGQELIAETGLDTTLDTSVIAPKVKVKMFKNGRGKGLVAREKILEGEVLWSEDPWVVTTDR